MILQRDVVSIDVPDLERIEANADLACIGGRSPLRLRRQARVEGTVPWGYSVASPDLHEIRKPKQVSSKRQEVNHDT